MFLARSKLTSLVRRSTTLRSFSSFSDAASTNLVNFYDSLPERKLSSLSEVRELLIAIKENKPESEIQCKNASAPLNDFFEDTYRSLNPNRNIETLREILEVGQLCTQLYPTLGVGQAFRKEPWFWVWNGLEEAIILEVNGLEIGEAIRAYQIFFANQKGSDKLWRALTRKFITYQDREWKSDETRELLQRQEIYSNFYKE